MRYLIVKIDPDPRTHAEYLKDLEEVPECGKKSVRGVKGASSLLDIKHLDIVWNMPPDYMHGSLMGVTKQLYNFWQSSFSKADKAKLKGRMSKIRLSHGLRRSLRLLEHTGKYKALEWKLWLLFVSVPYLDGILNKEMFESYL